MSQRDNQFDIDKLLEIMAALRNPVSGCPWDIEQTFETIASYTIEEAYEVADAIERRDLTDLREELGDLLLQVVYHAEMAAEGSHFEFSDVVDGITRKMIRRHPHVFGTEEERANGPPVGFWERIKSEEKREKERERQITGQQSSQSPDGLLGDVPANLPSLTRATKLQSKAAKVGFDWPHLKPVLAKMREELDELEDAVASGDESRIRDEFGDLLFAAANVSRHMNLDPEATLRQANAKFVRRFTQVEGLLAAQGATPASATLDEMDTLWNEVKKAEQSSQE